jgi:hypothetical protein
MRMEGLANYGPEIDHEAGRYPTGTAPRQAGAAGATPDYSALDALMSQIRQQQPSNITAPTVQGAPYDYGEYAKAKERTGLQAQAAMRGLSAHLQRRGISGSGIDAEMSADVYGKGVQSIADIDRRLASDAAGRQFDASKLNAGWQLEAAQANQSAQERQMELLARLVSMRY